jgi:hypothetical protein
MKKGEKESGGVGSGQSNQPIPVFSSARERRLWIWTLVVIAAIYSTLGLAATLEEVLRNKDLFGGAFFFGFLIIGIAVLVQGLRVRPGGVEIGVILGVAAVYLMLFARLGIAERTHLFEYGALAICIYEALKERGSRGRHVPLPALLAIGTTALIGVVDECIQLFLPSRVFDPVDMAFNSFAAFMAVVAMVALGWAQRMTSRIRSS